MEKKEYKSPHGWIIIFLIVFTLSIFLLAMVYTVDPVEQKNLLPASTSTTKPKTLTTTGIPFSTSTSPPAQLRIVRGGKVLFRHNKMDTVQEAMKRYLHSLPDVIELSSETTSFTHNVYSVKNISLSLHGYEISKISLERNFYIYDCSIVPTNEYLVVTILMELPSIVVEWKNYPEYTQFCPSINPYIHTVELVYLWGYDAKSLETYPHMQLSNLKIHMVSWEDNLYRKSYEQVKNSPLFEANVPIPLQLQKEDLYDFLMGSGLLKEIPMIFNPPIQLETFQEEKMFL
jgi:hypothetical protein